MSSDIIKQLAETQPIDEKPFVALGKIMKRKGDFADSHVKRFERVLITYNYNSHISTFKDRIYKELKSGTPEFFSFYANTIDTIMEYDTKNNYIHGVRVFKFRIGRYPDEERDTDIIKFFTSPENIDELKRRISNGEEVKEWLKDVKRSDWW